MGYINKPMSESSGHLDYYSSISEMKSREEIIKECEPLLKGHIKCRKIWHALQYADYKKEGMLNEHALKRLFDKEGVLIVELLQVRSPEELLELVDEKRLGYLNEDEQILLFSLIKERMQVAATKLCSINEYILNKKLLSSVRVLEKDILHYQSVLRKRLHQKEIDNYHIIGEEKLSSFETFWDEKYNYLVKKQAKKIDQLKELHTAELHTLEDNLQKDLNALQIKPKIGIKDLQIQEKLFAFTERFMEANQIKNELVLLEAFEQEKILKKIFEKIEKKKIKMLNRQESEIYQLELKNKEQISKMSIKYEQEKLRLQKEINLRSGEITKSQQLASVLALQKAKHRDELRRLKQNSKNMQIFINDMKNSHPPVLTTELLLHSKDHSKSTSSIFRNSISVKRFPNNNYKGFEIDSEVLTRFSIKNGPISDRPVNAPRNYYDNTSFIHSKQKYLQNSGQNSIFLPSITDLYNNKLELIKK